MLLVIAVQFIAMIVFLGGLKEGSGDTLNTTNGGGGGGSVVEDDSLQGKRQNGLPSNVPK